MKPLSLLFALIALAVLAACHKSNQGGDANILMSHTWYPYQVVVTTVDSNTVTVTDSTGHSQSTLKITTWDSTITPSACVSQSAISFMQNGNLQITNACAAGSPVSSLNWTITQNNVLSYPPMGVFNVGYVSYAIGGTGLITQIDNSQFMCNDPGTHQVSYITSHGPNNTTINTIDNLLVSVLTTSKSK